PLGPHCRAQARGRLRAADQGVRRRGAGTVMSEDRRYWLAVASADHARRGRELGIMQVCHGKGGPLKRPRVGDGVVYYSPTVALGGKERLQAFTSIGGVADERCYPADMGGR